MEIITATYKKNEAFVDKLADLYRKSKKYEKEYQCLSKAMKMVLIQQILKREQMKSGI